MDWKPKRIDKYITKKFIMTFFIALLLIIGIVIIFDISEKVDDFVEKQAPLKAIIFDYYVNFVPYFINMFSPLFVFITVIFFTSRMAANSEIIAILSCGVSYHRMIVPYLFSALLIAMLSLSLNLFVIPRANASRVQFEAKYTKLDRRYLNSSNVHYQLAPGQFVYVESFSTWNNTAYGFTLEDIRNNKLVRKLSAETALWDASFSGWKLKNYFIRDYSDGLQDRITSGAELDTVINLTLTDFYRNKKTVEALPFKALNQLIKTQKMRGDANVLYAQIEKQTRWALPFSAFILTLIGVSLSSRKRRGGTGWNIGIGIALSFTYILFLRFSQMFVTADVLPPFIALWMPNFVFAIVAGALYYRASR